MLREKGATDVHMLEGHKVQARFAARLERIGVVSEADAVQDLLKSQLNERQRRELDKFGQVVLIAQFGSGPARLAIQKTMDGLALHARLLGKRPPKFAELNYPESILNILTKSGVLFIVGAKRNGKTLLATACVEFLIEKGHTRIVKIGTVIEYRHASTESTEILYRQIGPGMDVRTAADAVRLASQADVDVIVLEEILDADTARAVLDALDNGANVICTMQARDAVSAIARFTGFFQGDHDARSSRERVAEYTQGVVSLRLCVGMRQANEREERFYPATEILLKNPAVTTALVDNEFAKIRTIMRNTPGMKTMDQAIRDLQQGKKISDREATRVLSLSDG